MLKSAAIHTGPNTHLDHLVVICEALKIPLVVTEPKAEELTRRFYPQIEVLYKDYGDLSLKYMAEHWDVLFTCGKFWAMDLLPLFQNLYQKNMRFVFCPHGNSDKEASIKHPITQDLVLVYGNHMMDILKNNGTQAHLKQTITIGNLRYPFYQKYRNHFDTLAKEIVFSSLDPKKSNILYCPTWHNEDSPSSFFHCVETLVHALNAEYNLIIKPHPLLEETHPAEFFILCAKFENYKNVCLVNDFPPIYPLLEKTHLYIGDFSSIGYDFLLYDRPMLFLKPSNKGMSFLHQCGRVLEYSEINQIAKHVKEALKDRQQSLSAVRKKTYTYAFREKIGIGDIKKHLLKNLTE